MTYEEKLKDLRTARKTLHILEDRGILENNLSMEQITAIRTAEYALDELCKSKDAQPVKRGSWIKAQDKQGSYFLCSNCGTAEKTESDQDGTVWQHDEYCRKCGARMDGEQNV